MGGMDFSWGKFDLGELWTQNGGKWVITVLEDKKLGEWWILIINFIYILIINTGRGEIKITASKAVK